MQIIGILFIIAGIILLLCLVHNIKVDRGWSILFSIIILILFMCGGTLCSG